MNKKFLFRLVLPLAVIAIINLILASYLANLYARNLMLNFGTEILGIIVTVIFVDQVIKSNEKERWGRVNRQVILRLDIVVFNILDSLIKLFDLRDGCKVIITIQSDMARYNRRVLKISESKFQKEWLASKVANFEADQADLVEIKKDTQSLTSILDLFSGVLEPDQAERLFRIQTILTENMNEYFRVNINIKESTSEDEHTLRTLGSFILIHDFSNTLNILLGDLLELIRYIEKEQKWNLIELES